MLCRCYLIVGVAYLVHAMTHQLPFPKSSTVADSYGAKSVTNTSQAAHLSLQEDMSSLAREDTSSLAREDMSSCKRGHVFSCKRRPLNVKIPGHLQYKHNIKTSPRLAFGPNKKKLLFFFWGGGRCFYYNSQVQDESAQETSADCAFAHAE